MSRRRLVLVGAILLPFILALVAVASVLFMAQGGFAPYRVPHGRRVVVADATAVERGAYLARIGDCAACHTARGGAAYGGGRAFATAYGTVYSSNLSADPKDGIGDWSIDEFTHVMRNGVSRSGVLYPVFPYAHFAQLAGDDLDALFAYLQTVPQVAAPVPPNQLEFPARSRLALIGWRMLYYRPVALATASAPATGASRLERGRYLVDALGHCAMCHSARGRGGSLPSSGYLAGGLIPGVGWYAPPLDQSSLARYSETDLAAYLQSGTSRHGSAYGPMAEVVYASLRWLDDGDALAIAAYLKSVPSRPLPREPLLPPERAATRETAGIDAAGIYKNACAGCHGEDGEGKDGVYPPLRDSVAITAPDPINAVRIVLYGAMAPTTPRNPRPHSMPPFVQRLRPAEIAAVLNHLRVGVDQTALSTADVEAMHGIVLD